MDDVHKLGKENVSQFKIKLENIEDVSRTESLKIEFKMEVIKGADANIIDMDIQEAESTYMGPTVNNETGVKADDPEEDAVDEQEEIQTISSSIGVQTLVIRVLDEDIKLFHAEVASEVKAALNLYYPEAKEFMGETRIRSREKYKQVARQLSHQLREQIKESHRVLYGGLQGPPNIHHEYN